jgi:hypothetical protein
MDPIHISEDLPVTLQQFRALQLQFLDLTQLVAEIAQRLVALEKKSDSPWGNLDAAA